MPSFFKPFTNYVAGADIGGQNTLSINNISRDVIVQQARVFNYSTVVYGTDNNVVLYNIQTKTTTPVANRGISFLRGGYNRWAGRLQSNPPVYFDSTGRELINSDYRPIGCCPVGIVLSNYQSGKGLFLLKDDNSIQELLPSNISVFGDEGSVDSNTWAMRISLKEIAYGKFDGSAPKFIQTKFNNRDIAISNKYILTQDVDNNKWVIINCENNTYAVIPNLNKPGIAADIVFDDGLFTIVGSSNQGCSPGSMWVETINNSALSWSELNSTTPEQPNPIKDNYSAYPRRVFFAPYFSFSPQYGNTETYYGNVTWGPNPIGLPMLSSLSDYKNNPKINNMTLCWYMHGNGSDFNSSKDIYEEVLTLPQKGIIFYQDTKKPEDWNNIPNWIVRDRTFMSFPAYRDVNENIHSWAAKCEDIMNKILDAGFEFFVLTPQFYDRNFTVPINQVIENMEYFDKWVRDYPIIGIMPFADMRPSGMVSYPILYEYARMMAQACPGRPNRLDFWTHDDEATWKENLKEKLNYTMLILKEKEKNYLRGLL